jgi:hypothetical protein
MIKASSSGHLIHWPPADGALLTLERGVMDLPVRGWIDVNGPRLQEFMQVLIRTFSNHPVQLAVWHSGRLPTERLPAQPIGSASPFEGSDSQLAGNGILIPVEPETMDQILHILFKEGDFTHLELASNGVVRFAAYDHFSSVCFRQGLSRGMLEALKKEGLILGYHLSEG